MHVSVTPAAGKQLSIRVRDHQLLVDQPVEDGGADAAPTPTELLLASLTGCVAHYARSYLSRHGLSETGLRVEGSGRLAQRPSRLDEIAISVRLPDGFPADRREALLAVASHCTVHNTLTGSPTVLVTLGQEGNEPPSTVSP